MRTVPQGELLTIISVGRVLFNDQMCRFTSFHNNAYMLCEHRQVVCVSPIRTEKKHLLLRVKTQDMKVESDGRKEKQKESKPEASK